MEHELTLGHQPPHQRSSDGFLANAANKPFVFSELLSLTLQTPYRLVLPHYARSHLRWMPDTAPEMPLTCSHGLAIYSKPEI